MIKACEEIALEYGENEKISCEQPRLPAIPEPVFTPRQAYFAKAEERSWQQSVGEISAEMIAPYPPGIPIIYPGERITQEVWEYLEQFRKEKRHIHGSRDGRLEIIRIIKEV